jgi:non-heme chloroperoxidase
MDEQRSQNPSVTAVLEIPNRGHSLTIGSDGHEVAQTCLDFVRRFV